MERAEGKEGWRGKEQGRRERAKKVGEGRLRGEGNGKSRGKGRGCRRRMQRECRRRMQETSAGRLVRDRQTWHGQGRSDLLL